MRKGFYSLTGTCARSSSYWDVAKNSHEWEAPGWKHEIDLEFSRTIVVPSPCCAAPAASSSSSRGAPAASSSSSRGAPAAACYSFFHTDDVRRSQNCAIVGRRVVSRLSFRTDMHANDVIAQLMEGLYTGDGDLPSIVLNLFSSTFFDPNGVADEFADAVFERLKHHSVDEQQLLRSNMEKHQLLLYELRYEHETRDVKQQLQSLCNAHCVLNHDAPCHLTAAKGMLAALELTQSSAVVCAVAAMREMGAYYNHGTNAELASAYRPDLLKFAASVVSNDDAFTKIFLTYFKPPCGFGHVVAECCRVFGAVGVVDVAERELQLKTCKACLHATEGTCEALAASVTAWWEFRAAQLVQMRRAVVELELVHRESVSLMDHVATSLGLSARRGQMLESFQTIFESMSRSLELVGLRRSLLLQEQQQQQQRVLDLADANEALAKTAGLHGRCDSLRVVLGSILRMFLR